MLRFKVDENLPQQVADLLARRGHDASTVHAQGMTGTDDARLSSVCKSEGRVVVTLDLDFSDVRAYPPSLRG